MVWEMFSSFLSLVDFPRRLEVVDTRISIKELKIGRAKLFHDDVIFDTSDSRTMPQTAKPTGHVPVPLITFSLVSFLFGTATELMGAFDGVYQLMRGLWAANALEIRAEMGLPGIIGILITAAASFGLIAAILGTPGGGRRTILGASAVFLSLTLAPAFAVWGIFWKPFGLILAVIWSWFSATIYARTHRMPCEGGGEDDAENVIRLEEGEHLTQQNSNRADGQG